MDLKRLRPSNRPPGYVTGLFSLVVLGLAILPPGFSEPVKTTVPPPQPTPPAFGIATTEAYLAASRPFRRSCYEHLTLRMKAQFSTAQLSDYCDCSARAISQALTPDEVKAVLADETQTKVQEALNNPRFQEPVKNCAIEHLLKPESTD